MGPCVKIDDGLKDFVQEDRYSLINMGGRVVDKSNDGM